MEGNPPRQQDRTQCGGGKAGKSFAAGHAQAAWALEFGKLNLERAAYELLALLLGAMELRGADVRAPALELRDPIAERCLGHDDKVRA